MLSCLKLLLPHHKTGLELSKLFESANTYLLCSEDTIFFSDEEQTTITKTTTTTTTTKRGIKTAPITIPKKTKTKQETTDQNKQTNKKIHKKEHNIKKFKYLKTRKKKLLISGRPLKTF